MRNIYNIRDSVDMKIALAPAASGLLMSAVRAALPAVGKMAVEVGKAYVVDKAISAITDMVAKKGMETVVDMLAKNPKDSSDVKKIIGSYLKSGKATSDNKSTLERIMGSLGGESSDIKNENSKDKDDSFFGRNKTRVTKMETNSPSFEGLGISLASRKPGKWR